ncbi:MAG: prolyl oligopeptidase family serine peptidase, partial [Melioribacteraceae bacterium]|nr:prolyl oligopeptidase family serine peptidase [Melioribacteraceae bacterium]
MKRNILLLVVLLSSSLIFSQAKHPVTVEDLWSMNRIGSFDLSPDGSKLTFSVTNYDMEKNSGDTDIWLINKDGSGLTVVKNSDKNESSPNFTPDGKHITFSRGGQIWQCDLDGSNEVQITNLYTGAGGIKWNKNGNKFLFTSNVYAECENQECNELKDKEIEENPVEAEVFTELMYRHWNDWRGPKRSHLFLMNEQNDKYFDLVMGSPYDVPPIALGSSHDYDISPDGNEAAFTMNRSDFLAASTNNDIFIIDLNQKLGGETVAEKISVSDGNDNHPIYSPDGKYIAFCSMARAGFEADKKSVMLYNRESKSITNLTETLDRSANELVWSPDSKTIYFNAPNEIYNSIYSVDISNAEVKVILEDVVSSGLAICNDGKFLYFKKQESTLPYEIFSFDLETKELNQITYINKDILSKIEWNTVETFWSEGAEGAKVQSILVKPPYFEEGKKYPLIFLIHGGPQGHWTDDFHYRWNLQMFASRGYIVVAPNPRGSVGYGQQFTDEISQDWGGRVYTDLMNVYDYALDEYNY